MSVLKLGLTLLIQLDMLRMLFELHNRTVLSDEQLKNNPEEPGRDFESCVSLGNT